jgi:hypothetical protein
MSEQCKHVESLIKKAAESEKADDAMKFAQAALNAANAALTTFNLNAAAAGRKA